MYNAERKQEYLAEKRPGERTRQLCLQAFAATEADEARWDLDLAAWDEKQWREVIGHRLGLRVKSVHLFLTLLRGYAAWCRERGYPASDALWRVEVDKREDFRRRMVASPAHLQLLLDQVFDPEADGTIDCVYRTFLWLAYGGLEDREALTVKKGDVDLNGLAVHLDGERYPLYPEAADAVARAVELEQFTYRHPRYGRETVRDRAPGELVMRGIKVEAMNLYTLRALLNRKFGAAGLGLSYRRILLSGVFYRASGREEKGLPVVFGPVIGKALAGERPGGESLRQRANRLEREYLADYAQWKAAFLE